MRCSYFKLALLCTASAIIGFAMTPSLAPGQSTAELFRITEGVTRNQMNFHQVSVPAAFARTDLVVCRSGASTCWPT